MLSKKISPLLCWLMLLSAFCVVQQLGRMFWTGTLTYIFLPFNLLLAWIPLLVTLLLHKRTTSFRLILLYLVWIIFFPNSAYIITDLIHLKPRNNVPFWFDTSMAFSFAFTGFMTGLASAMLAYQKLLQTFTVRTGKYIMVIIMFSSGYGIYMGRFLRWNSWDILFHPVGIFSDTYTRIMNPTIHHETYAVSLLTGLFLTLTFFALESFRHTNIHETNPSSTI
ncbi:MAG: DUF1361 domain-containing protein [Chitinophagales bacterium]